MKIRSKLLTRIKTHISMSLLMRLPNIKKLWKKKLQNLTRNCDCLRKLFMKTIIKNLGMSLLRLNPLLVRSLLIPRGPVEWGDRDHVLLQSLKVKTNMMGLRLKTKLWISSNSKKTQLLRWPIKSWSSS